MSKNDVIPFICDKCGHKFTAPDVEYMKTDMTAPQQCPKCGSNHTMPYHTIGRDFFGDEEKAKQLDKIALEAAKRVYKSIWK